jgi:hypothetical protein
MCLSRTVHAYMRRCDTSQGRISRRRPDGVNGELTRPNRVLVGNLARRHSGDHSEETLPLCLRECAAPPHSGAAAPRRIRRDEYRDGWRARARLAEGNIAAVLERVLIDTPQSMCTEARTSPLGWVSKPPPFSDGSLLPCPRIASHTSIGPGFEPVHRARL